MDADYFSKRTKYDSVGTFRDPGVLGANVDAATTTNAVYVPPMGYPTTRTVSSVLSCFTFQTMDHAFVVSCSNREHTMRECTHVALLFSTHFERSYLHG